MSSSTIACEHCGREDFESKRALTQHLTHNKQCQHRVKAKAAGVFAFQVPHDFIKCLPIIRGTGTQNCHDAHRTYQMGEISPGKEVLDHRPAKKRCNAASFNYEEDEFHAPLGTDNDSIAHDSDNSSVDAGALDQEIVNDFREYCVRAEKYFQPLNKNQRKAIRLMSKLRETKASLDTYDSVMEWHLKETGELRHHEAIGQSKSFLSRKKLFKFLRDRYNTTKKYNLVKNIVLPSSKARVNVVYNDARAVIQSLLTDPNIRDEDYLFFDNDPFAPPPEKLDYIADLNTGLSYRETYKKLITKPGKQILLTNI